MKIGYVNPWLRIQRLLRDMLGNAVDAETCQQIRPEIKNALAERGRIERSGRFY